MLVLGGMMEWVGSHYDAIYYLILEKLGELGEMCQEQLTSLRIWF